MRDLAVLGANCHRMVHAKAKWLTLPELKELLTYSKYPGLYLVTEPKTNISRYIDASWGSREFCPQEGSNTHSIFGKVTQPLRSPKYYCGPRK